MPNYHFHINMIKRSNGQSSTAAAAYRSGEQIYDERVGRRCYPDTNSGVRYAEIIRPKQSPKRWESRSVLWNEVERTEQRQDSQVAREVEVSLPRELTLDEQVELVREFASKSFVACGMVADISVHYNKNNNPHAHIMLTTRPCDQEGFISRKDRSWNGREIIQRWRKEWEVAENAALLQKYEQDGTPEREREYVDSRSYAERGINQEPQQHMGNARTQLEYKEQERCNREGRKYEPVTDVAQDNEEIKEINRLIKYSRETKDQIAE